MSDELKHYGVLGMRWGRRKAQSIGSNQVVSAIGKAGAKVGNHIKDQHSPEFKKEHKQMLKDQYKHPVHSTAAQLNLMKKHPGKALSLDTKTLKDLNADVARRVDRDRSAVKSYKKEYDKASDLSDMESEQWSRAKELYKETGKNAVSRVINNIKGESATVKEYKKEYNKASSLSDKASEQWYKAREARKQTGRNAVTRLANNIRY